MERGDDADAIGGDRRRRPSNRLRGPRERAVDLAGPVAVGEILEQLHAVEFVAVDRGGHEHSRTGLAPLSIVTRISTGSPR
nr:hypothetical protein [Halosimplex carlsbadense]